MVDAIQRLGKFELSFGFEVRTQELTKKLSRSQSFADRDETVYKNYQNRHNTSAVGWVESRNPTIPLFEARSRSVPEVIDRH